MHISYRAIKEPSKLVRRLRYVSQTLRLAGQRPLNKDALVAKLRDWSRTHNDDLANYKHNTGAAHSTKKKRMTLLVINYLLASPFPWMEIVLLCGPARSFVMNL